MGSPQALRQPLGAASLNRAAACKPQWRLQCAGEHQACGPLPAYLDRAQTAEAVECQEAPPHGGDGARCLAAAPAAASAASLGSPVAACAAASQRHGQTYAGAAAAGVGGCPNRRHIGNCPQAPCVHGCDQLPHPAVVVCPQLGGGVGGRKGALCARVPRGPGGHVHQKVGGGLACLGGAQPGEGGCKVVEGGGACRGGGVYAGYKGSMSVQQPRAPHL